MRTNRSITATLLLVSAFTTSTRLFAQNAPNPKFRAEVVRLREWTRQNLEAKGIKVEDVLYFNPFANIRVEVPKIAPGGSVAVVTPGDFPAGTVMLSERDGVTLSDGKMSATSYSARMTIAPAERAGFVRLLAVAPVSHYTLAGQGFLAVAFIDAVYRIELRSENGITVRVTPLEPSFTLDKLQKNARVKYRAEFRRPGESTPFEILTGEQTFNSWNDLSSSFEILFSQSASSPEAELEALNKKMADPTTTDAERNALMERMGMIQQKMVADLTKGLKTDPASLNKKQDDFGCGSMTLNPGKTAGAVEGYFICGKNFSGGMFTVAGTMTLVR